MYSSFCLLVVIFGSSPILTAVIKENEQFCSINQFPCSNGGCISIDRECDGYEDCADGSDELNCYSSPNLLLGDTVLHRNKRQATGKCRKTQWQCRDGTCIGFDGKCDGTVDCPDGSDETHALCRKVRCQANWFRCTYGACVDGTAACNGKQECADNSDELQPRCFNESLEIGGQFQCLNKKLIPASSRCDGVRDCSDGSDETVRACAAFKCPSHLFQCAYGACVDQGSDCNGKPECDDGSDESDELCNRIADPITTKPTVTPKPIDTTTSSSGRCTLPPYPQHGSYVVLGENPVNAGPGKVFDTVFMNVTCNPGYGLVDKSQLTCINGYWSGSIPECVHCGRLTPSGEQLIIDGWSAKRGEVPWHAGIYRKNTTPYRQICGGSLITDKVVVSAAHCFWENRNKLPAEEFAVAVGKLYRPYNNPQDPDAQKSDVQEIKIPERYLDSLTNFQDDIALLILTATIVYKPYIRPVCFDFDINFERQQLRQGNKGKVAGWGLTAADGEASQVLKVVDLPYVTIEQCFANAPPDFRAYITSDKICAGYSNGTAVCKGDSGGGLAFVGNERGIERYYLRGIVSTAPNDLHKCNANSLTTFTQIIKHEHFIRESIIS